MKHKKQKATIETYPSTFGSHFSMLAGEYKVFNDAGTDKVICEDAHGLYVTNRRILDTGFADYNRASPINTRTKLFAEFKAILDGE